MFRLYCPLCETEIFMLSKNLQGYPRQLVLTIHFIPEVAVCISKLQPNYLLVMTSLENAKKKFEVY